MDVGYARERAESKKREEAVVGGEKFVSISARAGVGESKYHAHGDRAKSG